MGRETVLRWTFVLWWYPFYLKYPCSVFHRRQKWQWDWWISTSVTGERQAFGDRRELSDGYGLGNLQLWVCFLYFRNKCWCHLYKEAGWLAWKRKEKLFWAGGAVDGGWGWPPLFWGGRPERGPCCSNPSQKAAVILLWWRVWLLHIFAAAVPQPLLPPFRSRTGRWAMESCFEKENKALAWCL